MTNLLLASAFFFAIHLFVAGTTLRDTIIARIGVRAYLGVFSLISIGGIVWLVRAYNRSGDTTMLWTVSEGFMQSGPVVMGLAFILVVMGLMTPNPTTAQMEGLLEKGDAAKGIVAITRHPFLWGVFLWGLFHMIANGDAASLIFFGTFTLLAILGTYSIDAKRKRLYGDAWEGFAKKTSNVPFVAIAQGRNKILYRDVGLMRPMSGLIAYFFFVYFHLRLFGVSPLPNYLAG